MVPVRTGWARRFLFLTALACFCVLAWVQQRHFDFEHDDAYISYRYAENWAAGHGPVFNINERVEGYSNFLHVIFLRQCSSAGLDVVRCARTVGTLAHFGLIVVTYFFIVQLLQRPRVWGLVGAAAIALHGAIATWARSGLETVPFTLLLLIAFCAFLDEQRRVRVHMVSGMLLGLCQLERPDAVIFLAGTAAYVLWASRSASRFASLLVGFLVVCGPHFVWRLAYYGYPLPNSYYLKTGGDIFQQLRGLFYTYNFIEPFGGLLLFSLPLVLVWLSDRARDGIRLFLGAMVLLACGYVTWVGGDHMPMSRFFVPIVPLLIILWFETIYELSKRFPARAQRWIVISMSALIVLSGVFPTLNQRRLPVSYVIAHRTLVDQWSMAGRWMRTHIAPGTLVATEPAGAVAYYSGLPIVDMLGVNDVHIAHLKVEGMGRRTAGHEKRDMPYVLSRKPQLIFRGVRSEQVNSNPLTQYEDGSTFRLRVESLGTGPLADQFGVVTLVPLYLWLDERLPQNILK